MSWLRNKLRAWLGFEEPQIIGASESFTVPAKGKVRVRVQSGPRNQIMTIVVEPPSSGVKKNGATRADQ